MADFFIEMGQGIVVKSGDFRVLTSALHSCTLITGWNRGFVQGGAFHYPANSFRTSGAHVKAWLAQLNPTHVTLVFAKPSEIRDSGTGEGDKMGLRKTIKEAHPQVVLEETYAASAFMGLRAGRFEAGNSQGQDERDQANETDLSMHQARDYGQYVLFGRNESRPT